MPDHVVQDSLTKQNFTATGSILDSHYQFTAEFGNIFDESVSIYQGNDFDWTVNPAVTLYRPLATVKTALPPFSSVFGNNAVCGTFTPGSTSHVQNETAFLNTNKVCTKPAYQGTSNRRIARKRTSNREKGKTPNVNLAFQKLRTLIPTEPVDRRLSKVETLRLAVSYINHLCETLNSDPLVEQPCLSQDGVVCTFCISNSRPRS